jgi:hypothetical protein
MRISGYVCVSCGMASTRQWNVKRHIKICHKGYGTFVTFTDYVIGRISGVYRRNSQPMYESRKMADTADLINHATKEFFGELARGQARKITSNGWKNQEQIQWPQIAAREQDLIVRNGTNQGQIDCHNPFLYPTNDSKDLVFGYRMAYSRDSLNLDIRTVSFCRGQKSGRRETWGIRHHDIVRDPNKSVSEKETDDKSTKTGINQNDGPLSMKQLIKQWTNGKSCYLVAFQLAEGDRGRQELIQIPNPKEPKQFITFIDSEEEHIDVTITNQKQEHWAARAIKNRITKMSDDDLDDFLRQIKHATFGVVRLHLVPSTLFKTPLSLELHQKPESYKTYFMAITAEPTNSKASFSVENENEYEKQSLSATKRNQDEMFLALRNDLVKLTSINLPVQSKNRQNIKL